MTEAELIQAQEQALAESQAQAQAQLESAIPDPAKIAQDAVEQLMPILTVFVIIIALFTLIVIVLTVLNAVQKYRQHKAIMRIDQNLQKLVDDKFPVAEDSSKQ